MSRARDFADLAASVDAGGLTGRNFIINGAMQVAQRGTSETGVTASAFVCDRFQLAASGTIGTYTLAQSTTAPDGFAYSLKVDTTTADASPAGSDQLYIRYKIEGQDLQQLKFGTASAESITLSFWCRSNKTGDIQVNFRNMDASRIIAAVVSINAANTWEYKTVTVAGDTSSGFDNDNGESLRIEWFLDVGPDLSSGAVPTSWEALSGGDLGAGVTLALADNTANEFLLTGVQLEVGEVATPFEHRSFGDELARCQRYFYMHADGAEDSGANIGTGTMYNSVALMCCVDFPVTMRTIPTVEYINSSGAYRFWRNGAADDFDTWTYFFSETSKSGALQSEQGISGTAGHGGRVQLGGSGAYIRFNAEL